MTDDTQLYSGQVYVSHGDSCTPLGEIDGLVFGGFEPVGLADELELADGLEAVRFPGSVSVTITVDVSDALGPIYRMMHDIDLAHRPRKHGHCPTCHPEMDVRPLAVDGHDYHRRQRARQRRRRRGH